MVKKAQRRKKDSEGRQQIVAVKTIDKAKVEQMSDIQREIDVMKQISHPLLIQLFETFDEPKQTHLILEYVSGGDLLERINDKGKFAPVEAATTLAMLCDALAYLHSCRIVHRDIKPENILYTSDKESKTRASIKLADFGAARPITEKMMSATGSPEYMAPVVGPTTYLLTTYYLPGTPEYMAPEMLLNKG